MTGSWGHRVRSARLDRLLAFGAGGLFGGLFGLLGALLAAPGCTPPAPAQRAESATPAAPEATLAVSTQNPKPELEALGVAPPVVVEGVGLRPLTADAEFQPLEVPGYRDAVIALPLGITEPRPLLVALHGNYDRPEWQCMVWAELVKRQAFVVCPRGVPRGDAPKAEDRWTYGGIPDTLKETFAGLKAARSVYADYIDSGPAVFTGFSLGAIYGVHILGADEKKRAAYGAGDEPPFSHAVLIEGGYQGWHAGRAKQFRADGGQGVLFGCGQYACRAKSQSVAKLLQRAGLTANVGFGGNVGHTYDGRVAESVSQGFRGLFGADPRWAPVLVELVPPE